MSAIIIANHHHNNLPLVIGANGEGTFGFNGIRRPQLIDKDWGIFGLKHGGKHAWLGVNQHSLFAGLTFQSIELKGDHQISPIVVDALRHKTLPEMLSFVEDFNPHGYDGFNLVFGNQERVYIAHSYILHSMVVKDLPEGINFVSNNHQFAGPNTRAHAAHHFLDKKKDLSWPEYYRCLKDTLATGGSGKIKIKPKMDEDGKPQGFGTTTSTILAFSKEGLTRFKYFDRTGQYKKIKAADKAELKYADYIDEWRKAANIKKDDGEVEASKKEEPVVPITDELNEALGNIFELKECYEQVLKIQVPNILSSLPITLNLPKLPK
jgi:hypothetical protein